MGAWAGRHARRAHGSGRGCGEVFIGDGRIVWRLAQDASAVFALMSVGDFEGRILKKAK